MTTATTITTPVASYVRRVAQEGTGYNRNNTPVVLVTGDAAPSLVGEEYYKSPGGWRYSPSTVRVEVGRRWLSRRAAKIEREETIARRNARAETAKAKRQIAALAAQADAVVTDLLATGDTSRFRTDTSIWQLGSKESHDWRMLGRRISASIRETESLPKRLTDLIAARDRVCNLIDTLSDHSTPKEAAEAFYALHQYRAIVQATGYGYYSGWSYMGSWRPCNASIVAAIGSVQL